MNLPFRFNTAAFERQGGSFKDLYLDCRWLENRIFLDAAACDSYDSFRGQADAAAAAYYTRQQPITGKVMQTHAPALAVEPKYLVEYVEGNKIMGKQPRFRIWLNVTIRSEDDYNKAVSAATIQKSKQQELLNEYGSMARFQSSWPVETFKRSAEA